MNLGNYKTSHKILALIGVLGVITGGVAAGGVFSLKSLSDATDEMELASQESILGARMRTNVLALNRAEFRIASDPKGENLNQAKEILVDQRKELDERLAKAKSTADEKQAQLLAVVEQRYKAYLVEVEDTIDKADRMTSQITISESQKAIVDSVMASRTAAGAFEEASKAYVDYTLEKSDQISASATSTYKTSSMLLIIGALIGIAAGLALGLLISEKGIVSPLRSIVECLKALADGKLDTQVVGADRRDEVGEIAQTTQTFKEALIAKKLSDEATLAEANAKAERGKVLEALMAAFEGKVGALTQGLASAAEEMTATASTLTATAGDASQRTVVTAAATEQASANVQTVASAAEELSASIREIASQVTQCSDIAGRAVEEARSTDATVQDLALAASKIGEVVQFISSIASQTNLLALNATIEAARAGDAGRGFAVVAAEVKALANQTAQATEDITAQISSIQQSTEGAVSAISRIGGTITEISEIASAISAAVEEQRAATSEIARNVQEAATGTAEVSSNVTSLQSSAQETGTAANQVLTAAGQLSQQSQTLDQEVGQFLSKMKAA